MCRARSGCSETVLMLTGRHDELRLCVSSIADLCVPAERRRVQSSQQVHRNHPGQRLFGPVLSNLITNRQLSTVVTEHTRDPITQTVFRRGSEEQPPNWTGLPGSDTSAPGPEAASRTPEGSRTCCSSLDRPEHITPTEPPVSGFFPFL